MEVCVDSIQSAMNGNIGGALRLELCSALADGGMTPSVGLLNVVKHSVDIPVFCMIRPRGGEDFSYNEKEIEVMREDVIHLKLHGADGFVIGCLTQDRKVDVTSCQTLLDVAAPLPVTFHRAFDYLDDPYDSLELLIQMGFKRILTSGRQTSAVKGIPLLKDLIEKANKRIIIVPAGGITEFNLSKVLEETRATEFHASAKKIVVPTQGENKVIKPSELSLLNARPAVIIVTDIASVKRMIQISEKTFNSLRKQS